MERLGAPAERYGPDPRRPKGEDEMALLGDVLS